MTAPPPVPAPSRPAERPALLRAAIWVAIGALIAAAIVCVVWVLIGSQNGIVVRAFLTILLLAGFSGVSIMDVYLAARRETWFTLVSMGVWIAILLIGAFLIWMPTSAYFAFSTGFQRVFAFLLIVLILQLAVLHVRLYSGAHLRRPLVFTRVVTWITVALIAVLAIMLVLPLMLWEWVDFHDVYWRIVVALTILATVGTALVPLVNALFAPRGARPLPLPVAPLGWPTYADGATPLPMFPDGSPDTNAYYTGQPSPRATRVLPGPAYPRSAQAPAPTAPQASPPPRQAPRQASPGYQGYPPPPPPPPPVQR